MQPAYLTWSQLRYDVDVTVSKKVVRKRLLHGIDGYVQPGSLLALMGSSGAGKTTLLDVIAQRKATGYTTGSVKLYGYVWLKTIIV